MAKPDPEIHRYELGWVERTQTVCPGCRGLEFCDPRGPKGLMLRYCEDESDGWPYPVFRARLCPHQLLANLEDQIGKRFASRTFATFIPHPGRREAYRKAREYAESYEPGRTSDGLLFAGPTRVGKTHLAAAVLREVVLRGEDSFRWVSLPGFESDLSSLRSPYFLVLDDLTELAVNARDGRRALFALINARYEAQLPTIVTTRMRRVEMQDVLGAEIVGRLLEMCELVTLRFAGRGGEVDADADGDSAA